jgi:hypothetical protein
MRTIEEQPASWIVAVTIRPAATGSSRSTACRIPSSREISMPFHSFLGPSARIGCGAEGRERAFMTFELAVESET